MILKINIPKKLDQEYVEDFLAKSFHEATEGIYPEGCPISLDRIEIMEDKTVVYGMVDDNLIEEVQFDKILNLVTKKTGFSVSKSSKEKLIRSDRED